MLTASRAGGFKRVGLIAPVCLDPLCRAGRAGGAVLCRRVGLAIAGPDGY